MLCFSPYDESGGGDSIYDGNMSNTSVLSNHAICRWQQRLVDAILGTQNWNTETLGTGW